MSRAPAGTWRLLARKTWRDAASLGSTTLSLIVLMTIGSLLYVLFSQSRLNLIASYRGFYAAHRFADAAVLVDRAPESLVDTARLIPGVTEAIGRPVRDGTIILRDRARRRVTGRFIGISSTERPAVNDLRLVRGQYLSSRNDLLVEQQFATIHELRVGDALTASYQGRRRDFTIVGLVASPEYLYPAPSKETTWASPQWFGVCWIDEDAARHWLGLGGSITELHVLCAPEQVPQALEILKSLGERYGLRSWWDQAGQPSNHLLQMDIMGFQALSMMFPLLFMFAAGLSLYSALTRIGRLQTGIVGFLRASGFPARQVLWHYICQGGLIAGAGAVPGLLIGHLMAKGMTRMYVNLLHLPDAVVGVEPVVWAQALILAVGTGLASSWLPARAAARVPPAEAMRGDRQGDEGMPGLDWLTWLTGRLPILMRISFRGLVRRPSRTLFAVGGLVCGIALLLSTLGMYASVMDALDALLYRTLRYELDIGVISPDGLRVADAVAQVPGVTRVEKRCGVTVRLTGWRGDVTVELMGLQRGQRLNVIRSQDGRLADFRPGEIWLTEKLAEKIGAEVGDPIKVSWAFSRRSREVKTILTVGGIYQMSLGALVYGEYQDIRRRLVDRLYPDAGLGAQVACPPALGQALRGQLERDDQVASVMSIDDTRQEIESSMGLTFLFVGVLLLFGSTLAGAVLHSVASVGILERLRELATLRSLGFSARATTMTAAVEMYLMATLGLIAGLPAGAWLNEQYLSLYETDTASFPALLPWWAHVLVVLLVYALVAISLRGGTHRLRTMDLAQATKARE